MTNIPNDPNEVVQAAIRFEQEGHKILSDAGKNARDPLSNATFTFLADQELEHIATIKAFAASLAGEAEFDAMVLDSPISKLDAREQIMGIFAQFKSDFEATAGVDDQRQAVYDVAMNMEHRGHDFYQAAARQSTDETARKLYLFLSDEESRHFEIIQETADFLKQPDAFMAVEERWMQI